jgi:hypothetical protein
MVVPLPSLQLNLRTSDQAEIQISDQQWNVLVDKIGERLPPDLSAANASVFQDAPPECGGSRGGERLVAKLYYPLNRYRIDEATCTVLYGADGQIEKWRMRGRDQSMPSECAAAREMGVEGLPQVLLDWTEKRLAESRDATDVLMWPSPTATACPVAT